MSRDRERDTKRDDSGEALRVKLDNVHQLLQVENGKLQAEMQLGEKQSAEVEELRQRLLDSEERHTEHEAEQWKVKA